jgi:hypothetical protein
MKGLEFAANPGKATIDDWQPLSRVSLAFPRL